MNWLVLSYLFIKRRTRKTHKKRKTSKNRHKNRHTTMTSRRKLTGG